MNYKIVKYSGLVIAFISIITMSILAIFECIVPDIINFTMCFGLVIEFMACMVMASIERISVAVMKSKKRIVLILGFIIVVAGLICAYNVFHKVSNDNVQNYQNDLNNIKGGGSFKIFPANVVGDCVEKYSYVKYRGILQDKYQIYLEYKYDSDSYGKELQRLASISDSYNGKKNNITVKKSKNELMSVFVAICNFNGMYEYAVTDDANMIVRYVFLNSFPESKVKFDKQYLPSNSLSNIDTCNIYAYYDKDIDGWYINK